MTVVLLTVVSLILPNAGPGVRFGIETVCRPQPSVEGLVILPAMPNPCLGSASIGLAGSSSTVVLLEIRDLEGTPVASPVRLAISPGQYEVEMSGLEPGSYVCVVSSEEVVQSDTLVVGP
jgi:hypothetical protein